MSVFSLVKYLLLLIRICLPCGRVVKMAHVFNFLSWILILLVLGVKGVYADAILVSLMEEDSVTLHTGVKNQQSADIKWYFDNVRIAQLDADLSFICTDVQCNEGTEKFRDRLKLDSQTGALTVMNIRKADSGEYHLVINGNGKGNGGKSFNVTVHDAPDAHYNQVKNPGESVTFNPGVRRDQNVVMSFFFNDTLIAEITVNQSQICTDVQCKERFTDRLKLDSETGSLTITNIRNTDSGNYTLGIFISSDGQFNITRKKRFSLNVITPPPSHLSGGAIAGIVVVLVVVVAAAVAVVVFYLRLRNDGAAPQDQERDAGDPTSVPLSGMGDS